MTWAWLAFVSDAWLEWACLQEQWRRAEHEFEDDASVGGWPCAGVEGIQ